jgi:hypothetical protein
MESIMHITGIIEVIIQIYFAIHAARNEKYWWVFIILFFPLAGSVIYLFIEYLPQLNYTASVPDKLSFKNKIKQLQRELEITDSIMNKVNLAKAYLQAGQYQASIELLEKCLGGVNAHDPNILEDLSYAYFYNRDFDKSKEYLARVEKIQGDQFSNDLKLLKARIHEELGEIDAALNEYKAIVKIFAGEEARARYALLLKKVGEEDKARDLFKEIVKKARLYPRQYKKFHRKWVNMAKAELK